MNCSSMLFRDPRVLAIVGSVVVWFLVFPSDLEAVLVPVRSLISLVSETLWLTTSISEWAYMLAAVALVCWAWRGRAVSGERPNAST